ncbi:MAG: helix-turn-helix domain-containing protein [Armatimonadetes bacterium]|nr:helix-turn-helix domain-containing protein [Armatimonadota bacterium]
MSDREKRPPLSERLKRAEQQVDDWRAGKVQFYSRTVVFQDPPPDYAAPEIKRIREALNMSQAEFATLLNVSKRTVESWEHGLRTPQGGHARLLELYSRPDVVERRRLPAPPPRSRAAAEARAAAAPAADRAQQRPRKASARRVASAEGPRPPTLTESIDKKGKKA